MEEDSTIIEIKYYKYTINTRPNIVHKKHFAMWQSAYRKIPELRVWCKQNKYRFLIMTERDIKKYSSFSDLITHLQTTRPNNPAFGHY